MTNKIPIIVAIVILIILLASSSFLYTVSEGQQVVITQFGNYKRTVSEAGLKVKKPIVETVNVFEKRILEWDGNPTQVPTLDKRYIWVDSFARWKITDPLKFFQTVREEESAQGRLDDIINSAVRNQISNHNLIEAIRSTSRPMQLTVGIEGERLRELQNVEIGRNNIVKQILTEAQLSADDLGLEIIDIRIKRLNYVDEVRKAVYERMIVERKRIAAKYRSQGEGEMMDIQGKKEKDEKQILSEAYKEAQDIKGKADAEAIKIYAEAYSRDPDFYSFTKTLESYEKNLKKSTTAILSSDSEYLKYLKTPSPK
jgi:modulator of FtsH protease HflC